MKRFIHRRPLLNASLTGLAAACAVVIGLFGALFLLELLFATPSMPSPSLLPPPQDRRVVIGALLAAGVIGFLVARRHRGRDGAFSLWSLASPVAVVLVAALFVGTSQHNEQRYLSEAMPLFPSVSAATLKHDGHQACDWLRGRHWGAPPELPSRRQFRFYNAIRHGDYVAPMPASSASQSTGRLYIFYTRYLRRHSGGTLAPDGKLKRQVAFLAWYRMCPFQQWAHTPVGGGAAAGDGD
jgi:hypothetical protein